MNGRKGTGQGRGRGKDRGASEAPAERATPFFQAIGNLAKLVLRSGAPGLPWRLTAAVTLTVVGKFIGVVAPLILAAGLNRIAKTHSVEISLALTFASFMLLWALVNFVSAAAPQMRDAIFETVSMASQRRAASETFSHALSLSLDYHQTKRSGALSRTLDRGSRAVDFLLGILVFNLAPTGLQLVFTAVVLWGKYDWPFAVTALGTIGIYGALTFAISNWRIRHRRALNEADIEAAGLRGRRPDELRDHQGLRRRGARGRRLRRGAERLCASRGEGQHLAADAERRAVGGAEPGPGGHGPARRAAR